MARIALLLIAIATVAGTVGTTALESGQADQQAAPIFGVKIPSGYRDWKLISVAHEEGNLNDLRAVLGNDIAINAYREGKLPFPDGTIIARLLGVMSRQKKTTKSSDASYLSLPVRQRTSSSWSRTQKNRPRPEAGGSLNSKTANLISRQTSPASRNG